MAKLKLSKQSLQKQRELLKLYRRLLPSLDLKRRQLTVETQKARQEHAAAQAALEELDTKIGAELPMLASPDMDLTGLVKKAPSAFLEANRQRSALKRLCTPDDVAPAVAFLASDRCSYMVGEFIYLSTF